MSMFKRSPWMVHYDGASCNGCDIEVLACLTPRYDVERFGVINTGNPKHADIFLVTGSVNAQNLPVVRQIYNQMLEPKCVVACGICACSGGVFRDAYNVIGGVDRAIPVDVYAPGCAIRPDRRQLSQRELSDERRGGIVGVPDRFGARLQRVLDGEHPDGADMRAHRRQHGEHRRLLELGHTGGEVARRRLLSVSASA